MEQGLGLRERPTPSLTQQANAAPTSSQRPTTAAEAFLSVKRECGSPFDQPSIARRPASVIRRRSFVNVPPSTLSVSVTNFASPATVIVASVSREKP
jgi:hypothetical protein